jgi:hypothetical protein
MTLQRLLSVVRYSLIVTVLVLFSPALAQTSPALPHLQKQGSTSQLIVGGKPFLILGGELGNSSASDMDWPSVTGRRPVY